jgi:hypothetical protein
MKPKQRFSEEILAIIHKERVLVRSYTMQPISAAYKEKHNTPGSAGYVAEMSRSPSRDTTTEFVPI